MSYTIKKLESIDVALAKQLIQAWHEIDGTINGKVPTEKYIIESLAKPHYHVFVAIHENQVVGGQTAYELQLFDEEKTEMFLYELGVVESHRQQGVAMQLISALKAFCLQRGIDTLFVGTEMENLKARNLYLKTKGAFEEVAWFTYKLRDSEV